MLFCRHHWAMVPRAEQRAVWAAYVPGQERTKETTAIYRCAAAGAIIAVAEQEGRTVPAVYRRMATPKKKEGESTL
jgi:hypothetical protein